MSRHSSPAFTGVYPAAKTVDVTTDFHGTPVKDPYRWLEEDVSKSAETRAWIEAQNRLAEDYLEGVPERAAIRKRLTRLWDYDKYSLPVREGGRHFFLRKLGLQNQFVLCVQDGLVLDGTGAVGGDEEERVLLDPNLLAADGTVSIASFSPSRDGRKLAYSLASSGSDWLEVRVRDVIGGEDLDDQLRWVKFSDLSWDKAGEGFFYSRYPAPADGAPLQAINKFHKLYYHKLGTSQDEDVLVYERQDRDRWLFDAEVTEDGRYLVIQVRDGTSTKNGVFYKDLQGGGDVVELFNSFDAAYDYVDNDGQVFYFVTDRDAPRKKLIAVYLENPGVEDQADIIPESKDTLEGIAAVGDHFVVSYLADARSQLKLFNRLGAMEREIALPVIGTVGGISGKRSERNFFYAFTSFTFPTAIYHYDLETSQQRVFQQSQVDFRPENFEVRQVFYQSKDGTRVPMFIAHRKGIALDGKRPTYLYGYGGFNISITPTFSVPNLVWMEMGGVYAQPSIRGGGEYGEEWHQGGMKLRKQSVFDDFIAAAEWLVANGYTEPKKLAIGGRSNGGLLVGACITQRPDLFGAALPGVGVLDMLRFHQFTIGAAWTSDYGSPDDAAEFQALYAYSPYHNVKKGTSYPATLITTADHDDRVVPLHSFKFAAALQAAQAGPAPILISIDTKAGHGGGKPTSKLIDEWSDNWSFLVRALGIEAPPSFAPGASS